MVHNMVWFACVLSSVSAASTDWKTVTTTANQCWANIASCPKHPSSGNREWKHKNNIASESKCLEHARHVWNWCGSVEGAVVKTRFTSAGETFVETISVCGDAELDAQGKCSRTGCWRTVGSCPNHPTSSLIGKWGKQQGAERTEKQCHDQAIHVRSWCGTANNDMSGSRFYGTGAWKTGIEVSTITATCTTGFEPRAGSGVCQKVGCWNKISACPAHPTHGGVAEPVPNTHLTKENCAKAATWIGADWCKLDGPNDTSTTTWYGKDGEENGRKGTASSFSPAPTAAPVVVKKKVATTTAAPCPQVKCANPAPCSYVPSALLNADGCPMHPCGIRTCKTTQAPTAANCPITCMAFDKDGARINGPSVKTVHHIKTKHTTSNDAGEHGPSTVHADCKKTVGGCQVSKVITHTCAHNQETGVCACTCK